MLAIIKYFLTGSTTLEEKGYVPSGVLVDVGVGSPGLSSAMVMSSLTGLIEQAPRALAGKPSDNDVASRPAMGACAKIFVLVLNAAITLT